MLARPSRVITFVLGVLCLYLLHQFLFVSGPEVNTYAYPAIAPDAVIQYPFTQNGVGEDREKAEAVKEVMERTWRLYKEKAWGYDEIKPVSGDHKNTRNGWGATIIDSMTTTAIMGMADVYVSLLEVLNFLLETCIGANMRMFRFAEQYNWVINNVDFDNPEGLVDPFETTIRYLGALVSTVDLLHAGVIKSPSPTFREDILRQAKILANNLGPGFDTPTGMIWPRVSFRARRGVDTDGKRTKNTVVHLARAGSHWLEYATLTALTGNQIYLKNSTRAWSVIVNTERKEGWPGIVESPRSILTGKPMGNTRTLGAPDDSHYEYLIKAHLLFPRRVQTRYYAHRWRQAMNSALAHLSSTSKTNPPHTFLLSHSKSRYENAMGHLTCFLGGNLLLGAKAFNLPSLFTFGEALIEGCRYSYSSMPTGIGPEIWSWEPSDPKPPQYDFTGPMTMAQKRMKASTGIWPIQSSYMLRPEVVESYFYGWRITGEEKYRRWAWEAFEAIRNVTRTEWGYSAVKDVTEGERRREGFWKDNSESFWSAETLKYLYLIFADPELCSLDDWVFNTEAHPLKRRL
ncbi:hypothetical protein ABW19_dt0203202 [Dactylella cylindrospora]|nr:hypothetical protein ABW19_dt0203202 [Dactylella cylindrospora]